MGDSGKFNIHFVDGPFVENLNDYDISVEFIDSDNGEVVHQDVLKPNYWGRASRKWSTNWDIVIKREGEIILRHKFNCKGRRVLMWFDKPPMGDTIGWFPYLEEFRKKHDCKIICSSYWNNLFRKNYPNMEYVEPETSVDGLYASYILGINDGDLDRNKCEWRTVPLQKVATDILGLKYKEIKPKIDIPESERTIENKYVCISVHSTLQCKYWNYPKGWQIVVNYLNKIGYDVVQISKEGKWNRKNKIPNRTINKTGNFSIEDRIVDLKYADMFIGLSSGLSWLSWAMGVPTVVISGATKPYCEPSDGIERVFNDNVCNGCLSDESMVFDRNNWNWCPRGKDFECSKAITPDMVIASIDRILLNK